MPQIVCRAPHGARGLKHDATLIATRWKSRAPHGARGLKRLHPAGCSIHDQSRPTRGAWIEGMWDLGLA